MDIKWIILDVDGVLTDGKLIYTSNGEEVKEFSFKSILGSNLCILNSVIQLLSITL